MFEIITTSKFECPYCNLAKKLLKEYKYDYDEYDVHTNEKTKKHFIDSGFKTVPQIYHDGKHIGGYENLKEYLNAI